MNVRSYGPTTCPYSSILEHAMGQGHIVDDIQRIGPADSMWTYPFESMFAYINGMPTNNKENLMELTFSRIVNRLHFNEVVALRKGGHTSSSRVMEETVQGSSS